METPDTFCGQMTEAIMRIFWDEIKLETPQYNKAYSHVLKTLESVGLNEKMSKDYESVNDYKRQMRERYQGGIDILEKQFPNGMFSKDKDGDLVGINVLLKKFFCEMIELRGSEPKEFKVYQDSHHSFNFMNRIRILFGKKFHTEGMIIVNKEVNVIKGTLRGRVDDFFPAKSVGMMETGSAVAVAPLNSETNGI